MFSPSFECSLDGLRSAVRLRNTLMGVTDPAKAAVRYMQKYTATYPASDVARIRARIELLIGDIEHISSCESPETCGAIVHFKAGHPGPKVMA